MASPPNHTGSPAAMSPPYPSAASIPSKKRSSTLEVGGPSSKRRKDSSVSHSSNLRQASFPPPESQPFSPRQRSPSVDASSLVSGSAVSGTTAGGAPKKKRGRKKKSELAAAAAAAGKDKTPSLVGGKGGASAVDAQSGTAGHDGDKGADDEDDEDEVAEMALEDVAARTQEQKQREIKLRAVLVGALDSEQYDRYEMWRAAKLADSVVKRVVNATVSQSVPQQVSTAVRAVAKVFAGELIEQARTVQGEWIRAGELQSELPTPPQPSQTQPSSSAGVDDADGEEPEMRRGPLRPDHLREAWRRYRLSGESHGVGTQQLWHAQQNDGTERFSTRTGRRMFK